MQTLIRHFEPEEQGGVWEIPFEVPEGTERVEVSYRYDQSRTWTREGASGVQTRAIVDLGLSAPEGAYLGASGSARREVWVSGYDSTPGYARIPVADGTWCILAGAYRLPPEGLDVTYTVTCVPEQRRWLLGDVHTHTTASDGAVPAAELAREARAGGLDFLCITDHNNYAQNSALPSVAGLTMLPGCEWTHYEGHAGLLGVPQPLPGSYAAADATGMRARLLEAKARGAWVVLNHPFCPNCGWKWGLEDVPMDAVEVWNGAMKQAELDAIAWWHAQLCQGRHLPMVGGSDYHRPGLMAGVGRPCTALHALSRSPERLLEALAEGRSFVTCDPHGPRGNLMAGAAGLGDTVPSGTPVVAEWSHLQPGDELVALTDEEQRRWTCPPGADRYSTVLELHGRFLRLEVRRQLYHGGPVVPAMLTNALYFMEL